MAYKYDRDLEFLKQLESSDLLDLFEVLVFGKDGEKRHNEKLTSSIMLQFFSDSSWVFGVIMAISFIFC